MSRLILGRKVHFSCGHRYYLDDLSQEENSEKFGVCASPHGHGHNYLLDVEVTGELDATTGMVVDLVDLDRLIKVVVDELDHKFLNSDVKYFSDHLPTTENIALYITHKLMKSLSDYTFKLVQLSLYENESLWVEVVV